jgi:poly(A) polymerase
MDGSTTLIRTTLNTMKLKTTDACRQFAFQVVEKLVGAGFTAFWAGGCVRDQLVGRTPKDYDVATNATPREVRSLFGRRRTLAIGQSFGVITVLGDRQVAPVEVATFREDVGYSDGRHPDAVRFSHAREDALRRDFTINGLFFDPIKNEVIDFVEGQRDLTEKCLRAIGDPEKRFDEDKLRMLRAIRFAADFELAIEPQTLHAIQHHATEIRQVSVERIANELQKMFVHARHVEALQLLRKSGLWNAVLPELGDRDDLFWDRLVKAFSLAKLQHFGVALGLIAWADEPNDAVLLIETLAARLKLSHEDRLRARYVVLHWRDLENASPSTWHRVQPVLVSEYGESTLHFAEVVLSVMKRRQPGIQFCHERMGWPMEKLNPPPVISGNDLRKLGLTPGPEFRIWLNQVRDRQLLGEIKTLSDALSWIQSERGGRGS